jgi:hypothetical protein
MIFVRRTALAAAMMVEQQEDHWLHAAIDIGEPALDAFAEQALRPEQQEDQRDLPSRTTPVDLASFSPKPMISPPMIAPGIDVKPPRISTGRPSAR